VNRAARSLNTVCALLVTAGGLAALVGWILHIDVLTRLSASFIPTQFNSALCFACYGLGLGALNWQWRWVARALGGMVLLIGILSLIEHLADIRLGIDTLAGYYLSGPHIRHPGRMATATAMAIASLAAALLLFSHDAWNERKSAGVAVLGSIAAAVGLGGFLSFGAQLQSTTGWVGFTQIGFPSAALCLLAGTNVLLNVGARFNAGAIWLPIPLCTGLLALLVTLTQALAADQDAAFSQRVQITAWDLEGEAETQMHDMFTAIDRMANRWNLGGRTDARVWDGDAAAYFRAYPGLNAMVWGDATGRIGRLYSLTPAAMGGLKLGDTLALSPRGRDAAKDALATGKAQISRVVALRDGQLGFLYINPVTNNGAPDGVLLTAISLKHFFGNVLSHSGDPGYLVTVQEDGRTIFSNAAAASPKDVNPRWTRHADFATGKVRWIISLTPTQAVVLAGRSSLPTIFFLLGLIFVALITASVFFGLRSRRDARVIQLHKEDLQRSEERYELAVKGSGVGLWDRDVERETLYCSPRVLEIMGIGDPNYIPNRNDLLTRVHPDDLPAVLGELGKAMMEKRAYDVEGRVRRMDDTYIWVRLRGVPVFDKDGKLSRVAGSLDDITKLKAVEEALKEMDRMKSEFVSVVSHELRTPLTAIRGSLGLMATAMKDQLPAKALHLVEIGYRNSERLIALVNDILDMEKLTANRMSFELRQANLADLALQAVEATAAYAEKYKVSYVVENRAADLPVKVDASRMAQVFANLLSNAAKFSPEGGRVRVVIRTRAGHARVEVIDRGSGMSEEFKSRIFSRFAQQDSSVTRAKGGTGLGLHITQKLVEQMGGQIGFESSLGQGTSFWVEFPIVEAAEEPELPAAQSASLLPRILHVEDDSDLTAVLAASLKGRAHLIPARTVKEAEAKLRSQDFDAIILDIGMPDGSGLSLVENIAGAANPPPVIILSAREIETEFGAKVAAILVKSRIAETEIADRVMTLVAEQAPRRHRAAS